MYVWHSALSGGFLTGIPNREGTASLTVLTTGNHWNPITNITGNMMMCKTSVASLWLKALWGQRSFPQLLYMRHLKWPEWRTTHRKILKDKRFAHKWTRLLIAIKTAYLLLVFTLSHQSHCVRICYFASTPKEEPQLMSSLSFLNVTWQNVDWSGKTVKVYAWIEHRPWQGKEGIAGTDESGLAKCAMDQLCYTQRNGSIKAA